MKSIPLSILICLYLIVWDFGIIRTNAMNCESCGSECARACGTRHFRTCCFNYVKKRSNNLHPYPLNNANYDILYGPYFDYDIMRRNSERLQKPFGRDSKFFENSIIENDDSKSQQNFYKPWKEGNNHLDNMVVYNDYEQQNNKQGHEQKQQQSSYEA